MNKIEDYATNAIKSRIYIVDFNIDHTFYLIPFLMFKILLNIFHKFLSIVDC